MGTFGEGNGNPLQYSCLENPMDGGAWKAAAHGIAEGWTRLSNCTELNLSLCLSLNYFCTKMGEPSALHPEMHSVVSLSVSSAGQQGIRF